MTLNPNWPVIDYAVSWANGPQQSVLQPFWCSMLERTDSSKGGQAAMRRGKQYELDQVQPGTLNVSMQNKDGALDPSNPNSPYAGYVLPYRLFRMRAQWPPSANLLTQNQATAGEATALPNSPQVETPWAAGTVPPSWAVFQPFPTTVITNSSSWQGGQILNTAVPSSAVAPYIGIGMTGWSAAPGVQYAFTTHARAISTTATGSAAIRWLDVNGNTVSTTTATATAISSATTWTTLTVAATAPANACAGIAFVNIATATASTAYNLQTDGWDVRKGTLTPGYVTPGTWFPLFTGYVERWPQRWTDSGIYGVVDLTVVDGFAPLSQRNLLAPFKADLMALGPNFLYALDETAGTNSFSDLSNNRGPLLVSRAILSATITAGQSIASGDSAPPGADLPTAVTGAFLGTAGPVVHSQLPTSAAGAPLAGGTALIVPPDATGKQGPPAAGGWTRLIAARVTSLPAAQGVATLWLYNTPVFNNDLGTYSLLSMSFANATMQLVADCVPAASFDGFGSFPVPAFGAASVGGVPPTDSDWHLFGVSLSSDGLTLKLWTDSATPTVITSTTTMALPRGLFGAGYVDLIGASGGGSTITNITRNWTGDLALAAELPFAVTSTQWSALAQSWRNAWSTTPRTIETSDQRYQRILTWLGYVGPSRISAGVCKSMGPATDIAVQSTTPTQGLQALQNVVDTENGQHFIGADGAVVFQSRADRYNKTPAITFGEKTSLGEIPYLDARFDFDPTRIGNDVQVTAQYGSALYRAQDATSQNTYGAIQLQRTVNSVDPNELTAAAQALLAYNKQPQQRLETLVLDPSSNPAIWPAILGLELGVAGTVNRRPQLATSPISLAGFIEQIAWTLDGTTNAMIFTLQVSNSTNLTVAQYGKTVYAPDTGSMTLQANITTAATGLTITTASGSPTATTKPASYPVDIQIDNEQIRLTAAPASGTSPQTFTITRGANGTAPAAHAAGAVITAVLAAPYAY